MCAWAIPRVATPTVNEMKGNFRGVLTTSKPIIFSQIDIALVQEHNATQHKALLSATRTLLLLLKMTQPQVIDTRSLWRIPAPVSKNGQSSYNTSATATTTRASRPRARLNKVLGIARPEIIDLAPTDFWQTWSSTQTSRTTADDTVVAIIGDLLRDKVEDKSLPWYVPLSSWWQVS